MKEQRCAGRRTRDEESTSSATPTTRTPHVLYYVTMTSGVSGPLAREPLEVTVRYPRRGSVTPGTTPRRKPTLPRTSLWPPRQPLSAGVRRLAEMWPSPDAHSPWAPTRGRARPGAHGVRFLPFHLATTCGRPTFSGSRRP
ncbi:hypothetical protein J6590_015444 [Homalodisca vitripennis]|nr:hypothetical protein J6590_015444 [Homalodisca vitripennis]